MSHFEGRRVIYKVGPSGELLDPKAKRPRKKDTRLGARKRGYDKAHERERHLYLCAHPICQDPGGCLYPATDLDHIDGNPFNRTWQNYRGLCHRHHSQRTARDQPGGWNRVGG